DGARDGGRSWQSQGLRTACGAFGRARLRRPERRRGPAAAAREAAPDSYDLRISECQCLAGVQAQAMRFTAAEFENKLFVVMSAIGGTIGGFGGAGRCVGRNLHDAAG